MGALKLVLLLFLLNMRYEDLPPSVKSVGDFMSLSPLLLFLPPDGFLDCLELALILNSLLLFDCLFSSTREELSELA